MCPVTKSEPGVVFIDLEFDTGTNGSAALGDIAASLVSLDELLRDLASIAAYPSSVEFRRIEIVAIEVRRPLKVQLSLFGISADTVKAFQDICRDIIVFRQHRSRQAALPQELQARLTEKEAERMYGHIATLENAKVPLKRIEVKKE